jgi:uncharacterized protein YqjF (DUF2071 family)
VKPKNIIQDISHRPWALPDGKWVYYQEWNHSLFLHWKISVEVLKPLIPKGLIVDTFKGESWISLVAFTMDKIRPRGLPAISVFSTFHEINLRTYVTRNNKPGVYFLNIEVQKQLSAWTAKILSGLPYGKANIEREQDDTHQIYSSFNRKKGFKLNAEFITKERIYNKTELDKWLTERYCLYFDLHSKLYRYEIHHHQWELHNIELKVLTIDYRIGNLTLDKKPDLVHFSDGVKVIAWPRQRII